MEEKMTSDTTIKLKSITGSRLNTKIFTQNVRYELMMIYVGHVSLFFKKISDSRYVPGKSAARLGEQSAEPEQKLVNRFSCATKSSTGFHS